jgi:hypothetical protein
MVVGSRNDPVGVTLSLLMAMVLLGFAIGCLTWWCQNRVLIQIGARTPHTGSRARLVAVVRYDDSALVGIRDEARLTTFAVPVSRGDDSTLVTLERWQEQGGVVQVQVGQANRLELYHADTRQVVAFGSMHA